MGTNAACDVEAGVQDDKRRRYLELCKATLNGNWSVVDRIYKDHPEDITARITPRGETSLYVATAVEHNHFASKLISRMSAEDLAIGDNGSSTALCAAAVAGNVELAKLMIGKNEELAMIRGDWNRLPICLAAIHGQRKMVLYLYEICKDKLIGILTNQLAKAPADEGYARRFDELEELLVYLIDADICDVALSILRACGDLAFPRDNRIGVSTLRKLAQKPRTPIKTTRGNGPRIYNAIELVSYIWDKILSTNGDDNYYNIVGSTDIIFTAARQGNLEFLEVLIGSYPQLLFYRDDDSRTVLHNAVLHRQEGIFKMIYKIGSYKNLISKDTDNEGNNMLHLAAKLLPAKRLNSIPGAALQMQFESLWFEEVKKMFEPQLVGDENNKKKTPEDVFVSEHKELVKEGEKWMKDTANSCMLVATLIATVAFAATFTVPGGSNQETGVPIFLRETSLKIFAISDAVTLVSSASSVLNFLSILTARYTEYDFLWSLPNRLVIGLVTLFISIVGMMVAFIASFFILFKDGMIGIAVPVAMLAIFPVMLFILQHYRLFRDVVNSVYKFRSLFEPRKEPLFRIRI